MNTFIVYMPRIAAALRQKGFPILKVIPNEKKPQYDAYIFEDSIKFREAFTKIARQ